MTIQQELRNISMVTEVEGKPQESTLYSAAADRIDILENIIKQFQDEIIKIDDNGPRLHLATLYHHSKKYVQ